MQINPTNIDFKQIRTELMRFMMAYEFALEEINTKINILKQEFEYVHDYNPIEHVKSRVKSPESIINKVKKKKLTLNIPSIQENIRDIAGIRITCSFVNDIYKIAQMLEKQKDITVIEKKDYIQNPKPNGYKSLHLIIQIPIFMSDRVENIYTEIQIRTIAMDFWASLEHKIYYKYNKEIPAHLRKELKDAAVSANQLDEKMERIHREINVLKEADGQTLTNEEAFPFPADLILPLLNDSDHGKE
ncbi:GTP pyrophosphokinase family protein [Gracilibacillus oryzae]|uniref:GTP pyrophosphokinase family protein n=1 Tax=Gracilibacillus oryzae TaxID=1672701 RepID=A0A7C8KNL9_9BACI|nr:GTP pyrophosphokinase family protein [Gracilibacillus oryzae]KAB8128291.1 GTP pyrophosphokinase family protein [Gracilibacillus oryzae]